MSEAPPHYGSAPRRHPWLSDRVDARPLLVDRAVTPGFTKGESRRTTHYLVLSPDLSLRLAHEAAAMGRSEAEAAVALIEYALRLREKLADCRKPH